MATTTTLTRIPPVPTGHERRAREARATLKPLQGLDPKLIRKVMKTVRRWT